MNYNHFFTNNGCTRISNGWQITNTTSTSNSLRFADTLPFGSGSFSTCTIECVYSSYQSRGEIIFQPKTTNSIMLGLSETASRFIISTTNTKSQFDTYDGRTVRGFHTVSININGGLMDCSTVLNSIVGNNYFAPGTYAGIGARSNNATYSFDGTIHALRVYNRLLTREEMYRNQLIDKKRFGLDFATGEPRIIDIKTDLSSNGQLVGNKWYLIQNQNGYNYYMELFFELYENTSQDEGGYIYIRTENFYKLDYPSFYVTTTSDNAFSDEHIFIDYVGSNFSSESGLISVRFVLDTSGATYNSGFRIHCTDQSIPYIDVFINV